MNYEDRKIQITKCPECGCTEIAEDKIYDKHTCGLWNEKRKFSCGFEQYFSPNYNHFLIEGECQRTEKHKERKKNREAIKAKLFKYIGKLKVDEEYKDRILGWLQYI